MLKKIKRICKTSVLMMNVFGSVQALCNSLISQWFSVKLINKLHREI